jgi:hypothetical protein
VLGLLYGGVMLVNFAWHRAVPFTNPKPNESGGLLNFHVGFLNDIPILWTVFAVIVIIGAIYYLAAGRNNALPPLVTPEADDAPLDAAGS